MFVKFIATALIFAGVVAGAPAPVQAESKLLPEIHANEEGMHVQPWFLNSFLDLREDLNEAAAKGKQLVIFWEQKGCPYCREMHRVNLRIPEVVDYIRANFHVIQLNLWGDREVTDFDGKVITEKKLGRKWRVQFTPTLSFFPPTLAKGSKESGRDLEVWRLIGYWKPFHFLNTFRYVREKGYDSEPNFQRWLQNLARKMQAEGKDVKLW
ncbi:MAG: thioredoxin fold domain-containing protein [Rhodospirillales bacterium]|nr:thioredoxin fold domain-containing protein [Rhodospirillales bacterium]